MQIEVILDARARPEELAELGRLAERFGLDGVWVSSLPDSRDPFTNLALLARTTSRIRLGPVAVNPFDSHPVRIASALLTLNEIAGGRAPSASGGGGEALQSLGIRPHRRVRAVRECVDIIRAAARGEPVHYHGDLYRVDDLHLRWLESPAPRVLVGASQEQMLRMAARSADGIMMSDMPPGPAAAAFATFTAACAGAGRPADSLHTTVFTAWHVGPDLARARHEARRWLLLRGIFRPWLLAGFLEPADVARVMGSQAAFARAFATGSATVEGVPDRILDALVDNVTLTGTPDTLDTILMKLGHLRQAGLQGVALRLYAEPAASIRLLGRRVLPALRA
ncbi:MAG: LLM class flavin-dependent oxidoreductase [Gammaproteobacteria bacterium]|nr:LLM class flavin-dependent oxidoreductase [Gammaproteobacteria bacterium]